MLWRCKPVPSSTESLLKIAHSFWCLEHMWISFAAEQSLPITPMQGIHMFASSPSLEGKQHLWLTSNQWDMAKVTVRQSHDSIALCNSALLSQTFVLVSIPLPTCWLWRSKLLWILQPQEMEYGQQPHGEGRRCFSSWACRWERTPSTMLVVASWRGFG